MDDRSRDIAVNVALNMARDFTVAAINNGSLDPDNVNAVVNHFTSLTAPLVDVVVGTHASTVVEQNVQAAFPGTTVQHAVAPFGPADQMPTAPQPVGPVAQPFPVAASPYPQAGPAPIPGGVTNPVEADWTELFQNPGNWYDNRADKASGKTKATAPDFKHKTRKTPDGKWNVGLYVSNKDTPAWVKQQLGG